MDVLETKTLYEQTLPVGYGYPSMEQALKKNPMTMRQGDEQMYVKVRKIDGLTLRYEKQMDWSDRFKVGEPDKKKK